MFAIKERNLVGRPQLWTNLVRYGLHRVKNPKTRHMMSTSRDHSQRPRLCYTTTTNGGEWWTVLHVGTSTTASGVKGERKSGKKKNRHKVDNFVPKKILYL